MWIRTKDKQWYVYEFRGTCISWVSAKNKAFSFNFSVENIDNWITTLNAEVGLELEAVIPFA